MTAPKLHIGALSKSFGPPGKRVEVLHDITLVGTSGCGKSTLLSIVAGLQDFDAGDLDIDGAPILKPGLDRGVVFQSYTLLPWLTAQQNIEFALKAAGEPAARCREIARVTPAGGQPWRTSCRRAGSVYLSGKNREAPGVAQQQRLQGDPQSQP